MVVSEVMEGTLRVQATKSRPGFEVTTDGTGVVGHAGAALLRELADRLELTRALGWRDPGGWAPSSPGRCGAAGSGGDAG